MAVILFSVLFVVFVFFVPIFCFKNYIFLLQPSGYVDVFFRLKYLLLPVFSVGLVWWT